LGNLTAKVTLAVPVSECLNIYSCGSPGTFSLFGPRGRLAGRVSLVTTWQWAPEVVGPLRPLGEWVSGSSIRSCTLHLAEDLKVLTGPVKTSFGYGAPMPLDGVYAAGVLRPIELT
jgi:hypothetical protein